MNAPLQPPRKLLVRSPNWLGDAVMATPALMRLRKKLPATAIWVLAPEKLTELYQHNPAIAGVLSFSKSEGLLSVARRIRAGEFDAALVLPNSHRSALEVWLAGVPDRAGVSVVFRNWLLTRSTLDRPGRVKMHKLSDAEVKARLGQGAGAQPMKTADAHQVNDYLHLVAALFGTDPTPLPPTLNVTEAEVRKSIATFALPADRPLLGMNPAAQYGPAKRWPVERFIATGLRVAESLKKSGVFPLWLLFGAPEEEAVCESISSALNAAHPGTAINMAGKTSLRQLMALLSETRVLLTNDSGPMHLAAALGIPAVAIFGSTSPDLTGPVPSGNARSHEILRSTVGCSPCFRRECPVGLLCMKEISHEHAASAVVKVFRNISFGPSITKG